MTSVNWAGNYTYRAESLVKPRSVEELQDVIAGAKQVKALGSRHSFNDVADSPGIQVSLENLPAELTIDEAAHTVTVNAGARYGEFVERLNDAGWAIHNLASLPHISVAGAISTGTHGSGDGNLNLAAVVAGLELITADGLTLSVKRGDPSFEGTVVAVGALGIVTRVTLDIEPTFDVRQDVFVNLGWPALRDHFNELTSSAYSVSMFTDWGEQGANQVWLKSRVDVGTAASQQQELFGATRATHAMHPLPDGPSANSTEQGGVPGPWWNRLAHFTLEFTPSDGQELQSEYLFGREHAIDAIEAMRALQPRLAPHLMVAEIRTMRADDLWLSPAYGRDTVGLHFTWKQDDAVQELLPLMEDALAPFDARPHWGKLFTTNAARLLELYPKLPEFRELAGRLDPNGKFRNPYLDRTIFGA
ncbi:D-arabinono-1,4-lactone oxidase [Glaciihabitans sp. UYNi722]|uniref:D-arabinono-1,4-lactone oxidase n=1 Tax=Glaciihabitans sp. UYNi722 TaxID=3156344 RepID=UPI0033975C49